MRKSPRSRNSSALASGILPEPKGLGRARDRRRFEGQWAVRAGRRVVKQTLQARFSLDGKQRMWPLGRDGGRRAR